jgi:predicted Zn-dependent protease
MGAPPLPPVLATTQQPSPLADDAPAIPPGPGFPPFPNLHIITGGCWLINYEPLNSTTVRFDGTLRVENHPVGGPVSGRTASADLYQRPVLTIPPIVIPGHPPRPPITIPLPPPSPANGIPIQRRDRYKYYVRVVKIDEGLSIGPTFKMDLEFWRYTGTSPTVVSFALEGTYTATMAWKTAPLGYPAPGSYAEGELKSLSTGQVTGNFKMGWISKYYRKTSLEIDTVSGSEAPEANNGIPAVETWKSVFDKVGYEMTVNLNDRNIPEASGAKWNEAELHAAMVAHRRAGASLDQEWLYYLLVVKDFDIGVFGVMFDSALAGGADPNMTPREGLAIGSHVQLDSDARWGSNSGKRFGQATSPFFRTACHELGHAFGLYHKTNEVDNSFMTRTVTILGKSTAANPFDNQILWNYGLDDIKRLRHFPDVYVRPGGADFLIQSDTSPPITPDDPVVEKSVLDLTVTPYVGEVPLGAPVRVSVTLKNNTATPVYVPKDIGLAAPFISGTVIDAAGSARKFHPMICYDKVDEFVYLQKGETVQTSLTLLGGSNGPLFPVSGLSRIFVKVQWPENLDSDVAFAARGETTILVTPPVDGNHAAAAHKILATPTAAGVLVFGGDHLEDGVMAIQKAVKDKTLGPHYACIEARRLATRFMKREANPTKSSEIIAQMKGTCVMSDAEKKKLKKLGVKV